MRIELDRAIQVQCQGAKVTSDAGLLAVRELDEALGLPELAEARLVDTRTGLDIQHDRVAVLHPLVVPPFCGQ